MSLDGVEALLLTLMQLELWQWTWKKMCPMCPACLHTHSMATAKPGNNQYYHLNGLQGIDCALGLGGWQLLVGPGWIDCEWKLARAQASIWPCRHDARAAQHHACFRQITGIVIISEAKAQTLWKCDIAGNECMIEEVYLPWWFTTSPLLSNGC